MRIMLKKGKKKREKKKKILTIQKKIRRENIMLKMKGKQVNIMKKKEKKDKMHIIVM